MSSDESEPEAFAQYVGSDEEPSHDDDDGSADGSTSGESDAQSEQDVQEARLQKSLAELPFGTILKARKQMAKANQKAPKNGKKDVKQDEESSAAGSLNKGSNQKRKASGRPGRDDKHAPTEVTSRRPVSRIRSVVDQHKAERRDPRFSSLTSGPINKGLFQKSYGFVEDMQQQELSTLRATFNALKAKERHHAGPHATSEYAQNIRQEKENVEAALRRAESRVAEHTRRKREEAVDKEQKQRNKERQEAGLQPFYLKQSERKAAALKKKFDELASGSSTGGAGESKGASRNKLKKAIERKRKKNAAKERKDLPFVTNHGSRSDTSATASDRRNTPKRLRTE